MNTQKGYRLMYGSDSDFIYRAVITGSVTGINYALIRTDMFGTHYKGFYPNVLYSLQIDITPYFTAYDALWKAHFSKRSKYRDTFCDAICKNIPNNGINIRNVTPGLWDDESVTHWIDITLYQAMSKKQHYNQISLGNDNNLCAYYDIDFLHNTVKQVMQNFLTALEQTYISLFKLPT